ncbi:MAG: hypothetical protein WCI00_00980 [bacterium]
MMIKIPEVPDAEVIFVSVSWAKLSSEEYIVTSGQTNHLDFWIRLEIVKESVPLKKRFPVTNADSHDQIYIRFLVKIVVVSHQVILIRKSIPCLYAGKLSVVHPVHQYCVDNVSKSAFSCHITSLLPYNEHTSNP